MANPVPTGGDSKQWVASTDGEDEAGQRHEAGPSSASSGAGEEQPGLEGRWAVRRVAGLIPPMIGVTKHITASSGVTAIARIPIARFDVRGNELRYRPPFRGVVDKLEPAGDQWLGQTLIAGTSIGRFRLVRDD